MELIFWINATEIEEPMGFDSFKSKIERGSEHGISAEVSVDSLEFYGDAADMVRNAYAADIDSQLIFKVELKCADSDEYSEIYRGLIDLSTYEELIAEYCSVSCKVGEIGVRTTFNNRAETVLNLHNGVMTDLDGVDLVSREISREVVIPSKAILFSINTIVTDNEKSVFNGANTSDVIVYKVPMGNQNISEIKTLQSDTQLRMIGNIANGVDYRTFVYGAEDAIFIYDKQDGFEDTTTFKLDYKISCKIYRNLFSSAILVLHVDKDGHFKSLLKNWNPSSYSLPIQIDLEGSHEVEMSLGEMIVISFFETWLQSFDWEILSSTFFSIKNLNQMIDSTCDLALAHETLSRVSEVISGMTVKSDWYGRVNSGINPLTSGVVGGGALKGLVKGLRLRNGDTNRINPTVINTSFKDLFLNLKAMDNVGWGFSEENGQLFIRVENWKWFYKDDVILTITNPKEKTRKLNEKSVYSRLKIGYDKYAAIEDINSVDTFHTNRCYSSSLKAIDHEMSQLCKFIADPYIIEFTRRKSFEKDTKDWKYDENIFVFALRGAYANLPLYRSSGVLTANAYFDKIFVGTKLFFEGSEYVVTTYNASTHVMTTTPTIRPGYEGGMNVLMTEVLNYGVEVGVDNSDNTVISPETMINFRLSPYRNACKFTDIIMQGNMSKVFKLTSGTGNTTAKGKSISATGSFYLTDPAGNNVVSENDSLTIINEPILKPETLEFEYPITIEQYNLIKQNPYGKIVVDGEPCYLDKFEYSFMEGSGNFALIPVAE
jgi:hypothetical protein